MHTAFTQARQSNKYEIPPVEDTSKRASVTHLGDADRSSGKEIASSTGERGVRVQVRVSERASGWWAHSRMDGRVRLGRGARAPSERSRGERREGPLSQIDNERSLTHAKTLCENFLNMCENYPDK